MMAVTYSLGSFRKKSEFELKLHKITEWSKSTFYRKLKKKDKLT